MTKQRNINSKLRPIVPIVVLLLVWDLVTRTQIVPSFMLPSPLSVLETLIKDFNILMSHMSYTLVEALIGLSIGILIGFISAVVMDRYEPIRDAIYPLIVLSQTVPTIAIAPLLVLWLGYDMLPKIVLIVLTTYFPIAVGLLEGFQSVDKDYLVLFQSMGASELQTFRLLKMPAALGHFFSALNISVSYSVVGAVISEWLGGYKGLGVYMTRVRKAFAFDKMFAVIIIISVLSLALMGITNLLRRKIMKWEYIDET